MNLRKSYSLPSNVNVYITKISIVICSYIKHGHQYEKLPDGAMVDF